MRIPEIHALQNQLQLAEQQLNRTYCEVSTDVSTDVIENHPLVREAKRWVEELRPQVEAVQAEIGGVVYRIPRWRIEDLSKKIEKIARRAEKLGVEPATLKVTDEIEEEEVREDESGHRVLTGGTVTEVREWIYVIVHGQAPRLAGWAFLATLQHEEAGTVIRRIPGVRAQVQRLVTSGPSERDASAELEKRFDLTRYREAGPVCDHCHTRRARKDTYIVVHVETGEVKQVGSNCLADFVGGVNPQSAAKGFEYIMSILDEVGGLEDEEEGFRGYRSDPVYETEAFLTHAALAVRLHGWVPRSRDWDFPTANRAEQNLIAQRDKERDRRGIPVWVDPEEQDVETAQAALAYVREELEGQTDFEHNLKITLAGQYLKTRGIGIAAAAILVYSRHIEREVAKKVEAERKADALNEHFGGIGDRVELRLTVTKVFEHAREDSYGITEGVTYITTLIDEQGRTFKWFGSYDLNKGSTYQGRWTIKAHEEYQGTKETRINRPAKLVEGLAGQGTIC